MIQKYISDIYGNNSFINNLCVELDHLIKNKKEYLNDNYSEDIIKKYENLQNGKFLKNKIKLREHIYDIYMSNIDFKKRKTNDLLSTIDNRNSKINDLINSYTKEKENHLKNQVSKGFFHNLFNEGFYSTLSIYKNYYL